MQYIQVECCNISDFTKRQCNETSNIRNQENDVLAVNCDMTSLKTTRLIESAQMRYVCIQETNKTKLWLWCYLLL